MVKFETSLLLIFSTVKKSNKYDQLSLGMLYWDYSCGTVGIGIYLPDKQNEVETNTPITLLAWRT